MFNKLVYGMSVVVGLAACDQAGKEPKTKGGVPYTLHKGDTTGKKAKIGDIITLEYAVRNSKDSVLQSTAQLPNRVTQFKLDKPPYPGSWQEGLNLLSEGDSVTFTEVIKHTVRIAKIQTPEEMQKEQEQQSTKQKETDAKAIADYVAKNKLANVQTTASGIHYIITQPGTGKQPDASKTVRVKYTGKLLNGTVFDSSERQGGQPVEFPLGQVIPGWTEGIALMKEGGKATLIIPSTLAYGAQGRPGIPPNSVLVFDVELIEVK